MPDGLNFYALSLLIPVLVSIFLAIQGLKSRYAARGRLFALLMFLIAGWSAFYGLELSADTKAEMMFWLKIEYLFIPYVPLVMLFVVQQYAGLDMRFKLKQLIYLLPIPVLTMVLSLTNEYHNLYYENIVLRTDGDIPLLQLEVGIWYYVHMGYAYLLIIAALVILIQKLIFQRSLSRNQLIFMLVAFIIPVISLSLYLLDLFPIENIDPTPFAFAFTGLAMSVSILRYRLLDLMPIAREHVFRSMVDGLVVIDLKNRIVDVNPESIKIFNWKRMPYGESAETIWYEFPQLVNHLRSRESDTLELEIPVEDKLRYYLISNSLIKNHKDKHVGFLLIIHDITMRYQMQRAIRLNQEKLRELNAEKDKLFSVIAHDLRGPLGTFAGLTELIMQQPDDISPEEMQQLALDMNKSARSLLELLENLLFWSRMQRDDVQINLSSLQPDLFVNDTLNLFQDAVRNKNLRVVNVLKSVKVIADEHMLMSVLRNLISNAVKFTPKGGIIHIKIDQFDAEYASIRIKDSGIGMDQQLIDKLFSIEAKVGRPGTEGEPSSGLGLILSHEFIEKMNGKLLIESEQGKGSTFTVLLPRAN